MWQVYQVPFNIWSGDGSQPLLQLDQRFGVCTWSPHKCALHKTIP